MKVADARDEQPSNARAGTDARPGAAKDVRDAHPAKTASGSAVAEAGRTSAPAVTDCDESPSLESAEQPSKAPAPTSFQENVPARTHVASAVQLLNA